MSWPKNFFKRNDSSQPAGGSPLPTTKRLMQSTTSTGEHLPDLLGARLTCRCDENTFFRDKMFHYGSLGFAGKRTISDFMSTSDAKGSMWRHRILVITNTSIVLFGDTNKEAPAPSNPNTILSEAGEIKNTMAMEDVIDIVRDKSDPSVIHIRSALLNGSFRDTYIRAKEGDTSVDRIFSTLNQANKAFHTAMDAMKAGVLDDGYGIRVVNVTRTDSTSPAAEETIIKKHPTWGQSFELEDVTEATMVHVYLTTIHGSRTASIRPTDPVWRANPTSNDPGVGSVKSFPVSQNNALMKDLICLDLEGTVSEQSQVSTRARASTSSSAGNPSASKVTTLLKGLATANINIGVLVVCIASFLVFFRRIPDDWRTEENLLKGLATDLCVLVTLMVVGGFQTLRGTPDRASAGSGKTLPGESLRAGAKYRAKFVLKTFHLGEAARRSLSQSGVDLMGGPERKDSNITKIEEEPEEDSEPLDSEVPQAWIDATDGDIPDAIRQWRESLEWRRVNNVDNSLTFPQPKFDVIKQSFVHSWLGRDKHGNLVTLEKFGKLKDVVQLLRSEGVSEDDFMWHCVFLNEFWIKNKLSKTGKLTKIVDLGGIRIKDICKEVIRFFSPMNHAMQMYPELLHVVFFLNAPTYFSFLWRIVAPLLAKKTREKIQMISTNPKSIEDALMQVIDSEVVPPEYGGTSPIGWFDAEPERLAAAYIHKLNKATVEERQNLSVPSLAPLGGSGDSKASDAAPSDQNATGSTVSGMTNDDRAKTPSSCTFEPPNLTHECSSLPSEIRDIEGTWEVDPEQSESMDPVLQLQGVNWLQMKAARVIVPRQVIRFDSQKLNEDGSVPPGGPKVNIQTVAGPVTIHADGVIGGSEPSKVNSTNGKNSKSSVLVKIIETPAFLRAEHVSQALELTFFLDKGDKRTVVHALSKSKAQKSMVVTYTKPSGESKTVHQVQKKK